MYDPIYSANVGLCGFRCRCKQRDGTPCRRVVPTYRGIVMHCKRVHGLAAQMEMSYGKAEASIKPEPVRSPVRIVTGCFGGGATTVKVGGANSEDTVLFVDREVFKDPRDKS